MKEAIAALVGELYKSQHFSIDQLHNIQESQLANIVKYHAQHSTHFAARLTAQQLNANSIITLTNLKKLRPIGKKDIQQAGDNFNIKDVPQAHHPIGKAESSGSTGQPVTINKSNLCNLFWNAHTVRDHQWYNRDYTGKLTSIRATNRNHIKADNWGGPVHMLYGTGPGQGLPVFMDIQEQLKYLEEFQPNILIVHAGVLAGMVTEWERTGYTLTELKHLKNIGDTLHDDTRQRFKALSGLTIEDNYSSSEVGCIAIQCPEGGLFHTMAENLIVEIINEDGTDCQPGEVGRVVVTDLFNAAAPIIRYDIGDYAEVGHACTCGRHLPTLKRILGRERGLFKRPDGSRFWPSGGQYLAARVVKIKQWQIIQHSFDDIEYKIVTDHPLTLEQHDQLLEIFRKNLRFECIRITEYRDRIPLRNGKNEETICLIE
jgi:phenylacetate-CoA ligase